MHQVVAHSNMIKWCVVWRQSRHLSLPLTLLCISILHASQRAAHRFPFPELCFENRCFILPVNTDTDRYNLTIPSHHPNKKIFSTDICSFCIPAAACHGGGALQIITNTHMRNSELACREGIQGVMMKSQFWKLEGKFRYSAEIVLKCYDTIFQQETFLIQFKAIYGKMLMLWILKVVYYNKNLSTRFDFATSKGLNMIYIFHKVVFDHGYTVFLLKNIWKIWHIYFYWASLMLNNCKNSCHSCKSLRPLWHMKMLWCKPLHFSSGCMLKVGDGSCSVIFPPLTSVTNHNFLWVRIRVWACSCICVLSPRWLLANRSWDFLSPLFNNGFLLPVFYKVQIWGEHNSYYFFEQTIPGELWISCSSSCSLHVLLLCLSQACYIYVDGHVLAHLQLCQTLLIIR